MDDRAKKYLHDIIRSIESIETFLGNKKDFQGFQENLMKKRAIERELEIIGEATNRLMKIEPDLPISEARKIVDTRNLIIHSYDNVVDEIIWAIVIRHLPVLKTEVTQLLG